MTKKKPLWKKYPILWITDKATIAFNSYEQFLEWYERCKKEGCFKKP